MQLTCLFDKIMRRDDKTGYTTFAVLPDNAAMVQNSFGQLICRGVIPEYKPGLPLKISGDIYEDGDFILRDFAEFCDDRDKAIGFLSGPYFDGIGKKMAASTLKKKMTEIAWATSSSSASITGAVAAIAEPPQIEEPTPISVEIFPGICIHLCRSHARTSDVLIVQTIIGNDCLPVSKITPRFIPNPSSTTAA